MSSVYDKAQALAQAVQAVCPIVSMTLDTSTNPPTFAPVFDPTSTPAQQQAAAGVIAGFNWYANLPIDTAVARLAQYMALTPAQVAAAGISTQQDQFNRSVVQSLKYLSVQ